MHQGAPTPQSCVSWASSAHPKEHFGLPHGNSGFSSARAGSARRKGSRAHSSIQKAVRRGSISSAYPHHLPEHSPHLMPSLCIQQHERDVRISALTRRRKGRHFACSGSPSTSTGSKAAAHLVAGKQKQLPLPGAGAALLTEGQDSKRDHDLPCCS